MLDDKKKRSSLWLERQNEREMEIDGKELLVR